jgi:hypothetical protein
MRKKARSRDNIHVIKCFEGCFINISVKILKNESGPPVGDAETLGAGSGESS